MIERTHELKTAPQAWDAIEAGERLFEVRKNDRFFQSGDVVRLIRCREDKPYLVEYDYKGIPRTVEFRIGWMLQGGQYGIEPGYCVFSLLPLRAPPGSLSRDGGV